MRVVQMIDSLESGGAERMAVTFANELVDKVAFSGLVTTREEGNLKETIDGDVSYLFLNKKNTFDFYALSKCRRYLIENKVSHIHAHGSSFFFAFLIKVLLPKIKLFWHDHHGNRVNIVKGNWVIKFCSLFFKGVFTVNQELESWAKSNLFCENVIFLPNFLPSKVVEKNQTILKGIQGKRIVCLANLRHPKNHLKLLEAFKKSDAINHDWTLHLIGNDKDDEYSYSLKNFIDSNTLKDKIFIYGSCTDTHHILKQADIGILVSTFEGFPVTLLEYGMAKLTVISTNVGYCSSVVSNEINGLIVDPNNVNEISNKIDNVAFNENLRNDFSLKFNTFVFEKYSSNKIINLTLSFYKK